MVNITRHIHVAAIMILMSNVNAVCSDFTGRSQPIAIWGAVTGLGNDFYSGCKSLPSIFSKKEPAKQYVRDVAYLGAAAALLPVAPVAAIPLAMIPVVKHLQENINHHQRLTAYSAIHRAQGVLPDVVEDVSLYSSSTAEDQDNSSASGYDHTSKVKNKQKKHDEKKGENPPLVGETQSQFEMHPSQGPSLMPTMAAAATVTLVTLLGNRLWRNETKQKEDRDLVEEEETEEYSA